MPNPPSWKTTLCRRSRTAYSIYLQLPSTRPYKRRKLPQNKLCKSSRFWDVTLCGPVKTHRRFRGTYFLLQKLNTRVLFCSLFDTEDGVDVFPGTQADFHWITKHYISEDRNLHCNRFEKLKSHKWLKFVMGDFVAGRKLYFIPKTSCRCHKFYGILYSSNSHHRRAVSRGEETLTWGVEGASHPQRQEKQFNIASVRSSHLKLNSAAWKNLTSASYLARTQQIQNLYTVIRS
jgi:hypothetical protein